MDRLADLVEFAIYCREVEEHSRKPGPSELVPCEPFSLATASRERLRELAECFWDRQHGED